MQGSIRRVESGPVINARWKVNVKLEFEAFLSFVRMCFMLCTYNYQDKLWYVWPCARSLKQWAVQKNQPFTKIQDTHVASEQIWRCGKRSKVHALMACSLSNKGSSFPTIMSHIALQGDGQGLRLLSLGESLSSPQHCGS